MGAVKNDLEQLGQPPATLVNSRLFYRPYIKWNYYGGLAFTALLTLPAIATGASLAWQGKFLQGATSMAILSVLPAILFAEFWFLYRPLVHSAIELTPEGILLHRLHKKIELKFTDLVSVDTSTIKYLGGWFKIKSQGNKPLRFTVAIGTAHKMLDHIEQHRPELATAGFENFRKTSLYCDQQFERMHERLRAWPSFLGAYLAWPTLVFAIGLLVAETKPPKLVVLLFLNSFFAYSIFLVREAALGRRFAKSYQAGTMPIRDFEMEKKWRSRGQIFFWAFTISAYAVYLLKISAWL